MGAKQDRPDGAKWDGRGLGRSRWDGTVLAGVDRVG